MYAMQRTMQTTNRKAEVIAFISLISCLSMGFTANLAFSAGPLNPDFEDGVVGQTPDKWMFPPAAAQSGYSASLTKQNPKNGTMCAIIQSGDKPKPGGFGNLMQKIDAAPFRSKRVRFRAAIRYESSGSAGEAKLWMRADRPNKQVGFFDNMANRPVTESQWKYYEIVGDVNEDAETIFIGMTLTGSGKAWFDDVSFEIVGDAEKMLIESARPLTKRGQANLVAFTRLLGYVRYFHPSDEASRTNWETFSVNGVKAVENAADASELAAKLEALFRPIAPTIKTFPTDKPMPHSPIAAPSQADADLKIIVWDHFGLGAGDGKNIYRSRRITTDAPEGKFPETLAGLREPFLADIGGGVSCSVPLALFTDSKGSLPRRAAEDQKSAAAAVTKASGSGDDRATRLADVALAWTALQHFYPYFDVVEIDWDQALCVALTSAATDRDESEFLDTLSRMIAALHDGHGSVVSSIRRNRGYAPPIAWDWVENQLVVTCVKNANLGLAPGDAIISIDGKPVADAVAERERLISGATPQWIRHIALAELAEGKKDQTLTLEVEPWAKLGTRRNITLKREVPKGAVQEPRPPKIKEIEPGVFYLDLNQIQDEDFSDALPKLVEAKGIVFDMRGYPRINPIAFFSHLSEKTITSVQWHIPIVKMPDHKEMKFERQGEWQITPTEPSLKAKKAFITDGRAISFAESVMGIVEDYKLGEIVGGPTAGTNGNINNLTLPGGYTIVWTGMKVLKHDGSRHHGVGIQPTIPATRTRAGIAAGRDELLERAVQAVK